MFPLVGVLVVHNRHSGTFPSNSIPVWVCSIGILAIMVGLVLHQVRTYVGFIIALFVSQGIAVFASHGAAVFLSSFGGVLGLLARHTCLSCTT